jgi:hypothetical protein
MLAVGCKGDANMTTLAGCLAVFVILVVQAYFSYAGGPRSKMQKVYLDESRCLVAPEIRGERDRSISCFCRDAIMDARYLYENYLLTGKDRNLNGAYLGLVDHAARICGEKFDVYNATQKRGWQWEGPQVKREYPPDTEILKIQPDSKAFRTVTYKVHLMYLDKDGREIKVEDFTAPEKLPQDFMK